MTGKAGSILIVDDNSSILGALRLLLERHFAKVTTLTSPKLLDTVLRGEAVDAVQAETMTKQERATYALGQTAETFKKVFPFILLGVAIGALIHNWIPQDIVEAVLGDGNPFAVVLATLIGAPIYADIFGTIPIAEALFGKGVGLGTILAFMMSVTVLSIPSLTMLSRVVKPKLLATFVGICLIGMIISGYVFNWLQPLFV